MTRCWAVRGDAGADVLRGDAGQDLLIGGPGADHLTGCADADTFAFASVAETGIGAQREQIRDFEQGLDVINLAALVPSSFTFCGTSSFSAARGPELRLFETPSGSTIVQLDRDGDGTIDEEIRVAAVTGLTAGDFVL
ncbi:M10 family metallopeptidase C-terminal domain-containing protein [Mameliella alba]|uniref:M10 family metallopeptidase C-terminal domain-containing protein n=1 Tax=Mameliella alba TaxID=561184 RepID=UPI001FD7E913|nr:M10 family metallopeptidase C-terminal domain-containing protein [Mameliella alba]